MTLYMAVTPDKYDGRRSRREGRKLRRDVRYLFVTVEVEEDG